MPRLVAIDTATRLGRVASAEIQIPLGMNYFRAYIARNSFPSRGAGGTYEQIQIDDGRQAVVTLGGLTTEVLRAAFWVSYDAGTTWEMAGYIGTVGGDLFTGQTGDLAIDSRYATFLREPTSRFRLFRVTIDDGEMLNTSVGVEFDTVVDTRPPPDTHQSIAVGTPQFATAATSTSVSTPNITCAGSERYLVGFAANDRYPTDRDITSLSFGAAAMSAKFTNDPNVWNNNGYELVAPSTTPDPVTVVWAAAPDSSMVAGVPFTGVDQSTPSDAAPAGSTGNSTTAATNITKGEDGDVRIALFTNGTNSNPAFTAEGHETARVNGTVGGSPYVNGFLISTKADDGTDDMDATIATSCNWYVRGWNINQAGASIFSTRIPFLVT